MNPQHLLDVAIGQVDRRAGGDADPEAEARLDAIRRSLDALLDDGDEVEPRADLAARACEAAARLRADRRRRALRDLNPARASFRWADLAVAAGIFAAGVLTLLPAIQRTRARGQVVACADNMRAMGVALTRYAESHGHYPSPPPSYPAGASLVMLRESGDLLDDHRAACPCSGDCPIHRALPAYGRRGSVEERGPMQVREDVRGGYASNVGFHDRGATGPVPENTQESTPLLSDPPPVGPGGVLQEGNSPNHGGGGQNVLYADGHVGWLHNRWRSSVDPDIYLNGNRRPGPGLHPGDAALLPSDLPVPRP